MISEFIWIELVEESDNSILFSCSLPDPDLYTEEKMVCCGDIYYHTDSGETIIKLYDNFMKLSVGEVYQRKDFVETVSFIINSRYGIDISDTDIKLIDCWGDYSGMIFGLDEIMRSVEE